MRSEFDANQLLASTIRQTTFVGRPKRRNVWGWIFFWLPL